MRNLKYYQNLKKKTTTNKSIVQRHLTIDITHRFALKNICIYFLHLYIYRSINIKVNTVKNRITKFNTVYESKI